MSTRHEVTVHAGAWLARLSVEYVGAACMDRHVVEL
jgi:hypothetical protein